MRLTQLPEEFIQALPVLKKIEAAGFEAYFVGGSVRDVLLQQPIHDVDIATSAFPEEIKQIFPRTIDVGIEHGTVMVLAEDSQYEITTFRTESTYQDYRRPDHVEFVRSLKEDLKRRDFTINAFALREDGYIIDLFDGLEDMKQQILRAVGHPHERFHEDALRMMRGLRFVSQLGFELEEATEASIYENHQLLSKISVERINVEFVKLMLGTHRAAGLRALVATECYRCCPQLSEHGEALLRIADLPAQPLQHEEQVWSLLIDMLQLPETAIRDFMKSWKTSNQLIQLVQEVVKGLRLRKYAPWTRYALYQSGLETAGLVESLLPYYQQQDEFEKAAAQYQQMPIHSLKELAIKGTDIMALSDRKPGQWISQLLTACERAVVEERIPNTKAALIVFIEERMSGDEQ